VNEDAPEVLSVHEAAELLGVPVREVYTLARRGRLPGVCHVGRELRIRRGPLLASRVAAELAAKTTNPEP